MFLLLDEGRVPGCLRLDLDFQVRLHIVAGFLVQLESLLLELLNLKLMDGVDLFAERLLETYPLVELLVLCLGQLLA